MHPSAASRPRDAIAFIALASFNAGISLRCVEAMLPQLAADFGTSVSAASVIVTSFALAYAGSVLLQGPLGDRYGKLRVITLATGLAGFASLGCAVAWDVASLAGLRLVTGIFASASVVLGVRTRHAWPAIGAGRFRPIAVHAGLLARPPVRWLVGVGATETFLFFGAYVFIGALLRERFDLSYTLIGLVLAGFGIGGLLYSASVGRLLPRFKQEQLVAAGGAAGAVLFCLVVLVPSWGWALLCTTGMGFAFYLIHNTVQTRATEVAPEARGSAIALYASAWALGQALGVGAVGVAVGAFGYAPMIAAFGIAFGVFGLWLRGNLGRLRS